MCGAGIQLAASQHKIPFTTFYSPFFYDFFPEYNGDGLQTSCSATYYDTTYPVAEITTSPGSGVFLVSITLERATETQVYIYTSDPADSTQTGCLYEYYTAPATAFNFSILLDMNFTELYTIVLTKPDQDGVSGTFSLGMAPKSKTVTSVAAFELKMKERCNLKVGERFGMLQALKGPVKQCRSALSCRLIHVPAPKLPQ